LLVTGTTWTGTREWGKIYNDAIENGFVLDVTGIIRSGTKRRGMETNVRTT